MAVTHKNTQNKVKDLLLLFSIPIAIAVFAALVIYVPRLLANPNTDFVYSICPSYDCDNSFNVDSSGRVSEKVDKQSYNDGDAILYYFDTADSSTKIITKEQAQQYELDTSSKSPDGYSLVKEERSGGFLLWGDHESGWYLKDGMKKEQVQLSIVDSYYSDDVNFLGWVVQ